MIPKQNININFASGLDTKTDEWQVAPNNFLSLQNQVFTTGKRLTKRNGYLQLTTLPNNESVYLTTLNGNLTALSDTIYAYNEDSSTWISKGTIQPMEVSTLSLIKNNINQIQCDAAVAPNGLVCTVYSEINAGVTDYKYVIADSVTGQNIISPTLIPPSTGVITGSPRVFVLGNYFILVFTNVISSTSHLQYAAVSITNPSMVIANIDVAAAYIPSSTLSWDGIVVGLNLYIAYNTTSGGQAIKLTYLASTEAAIGGPVHTPTTYAGYKATIVSLCADVSTPSNPIIYVNFYDSTSSTGYSLAVNNALSPEMVPVQTISSGTVLNLASAAQNGTCTIFYEISNSYSYASTIATNYINSISVSPTGIPVIFNSIFTSGSGTITASSATGLVNGMHLVDNTTTANISPNTTFTHVTTTLTLSANTAGNSALSPGDSMSAQTVTLSGVTTVVRSVGLASKAFIVDEVIYFLSAYTSAYQPTYFLINGSVSTSAAPMVVAKLAYQNGGGYLTLGLPNVTVIDGNECYVPYLYKDLIAAVNKGTNLPSGIQTAGIYSQTGINLGTFIIGTQNIDTAEIGLDLLISGGYLGMYDGYLPVEHNFFLYPDTIELTYTETSTVTPTGTFSSGAFTVTVSSATGIYPGMTIADTSHSTYIPSGTLVVSVSGSVVTISQATTHSGAGDNLSIQGNIAAQPDGSTNTNAYFYQVTYEWTDNQGNAYRSAPSIPVSVTTASTGTSGTITVNVPYLRLTYKIANPVKIVIYRWSVGQQIYYQTTSLTYPTLNSTTSDSVAFVDTLPDSAILGNNIIYTNGGVVEDVNGPASNIMTLFDTRLWLVDAEDPNLLWYSKQVIEGTPVEMSDLFTYYVSPSQAAQATTGPISALSPMDDKLIIFKANAIYYINGTGGDNTGLNNQYSQPIFITSTVGCINQKSIVFQPNGLMFQSEKGIWLLGRDLSTRYIGDAVEAFNSSIVQSAVNVPETNQVRFTLNTGQTLMFDYYYEQWGTFVGVPAISSCIYGNLHTFLNSYGAVYQESPGSYLDGSNPVLLSFTSAWFSLVAGLQGYQRAFFFYLLGQYLSPFKLQVGIAYDYNPAIRQVSLIQPTNYAGVFGGPTPASNNDMSSPYGQDASYGGISDTYGGGSVFNWRVFLTKQRCQSFRITLQEVYDSTLGVAPGAGLTLSGINLVYGAKQRFRPQPARHSIGGGTAV